MSIRRNYFGIVALLALVASTLYVGSAAGAQSSDLPGPVFGLGVTPNGRVLVASASAGVIEVGGAVVAAIPGVTDVESIGNGQLVVLQTAEEADNPASPGRLLYRVSNGKTRVIADIGAFEAANDPDGNGFDSNPFDVEVVNGNEYLIADAGGNSLLRADNKGNVTLVATFPNQDVPNPFGPGSMSAQSVPTSVVVGADGAYYVGELTGFPGTPGASRVWRVERGTVGAACGASPACTVVQTGFTSIIDLDVADNGDLLVAELDENGWIAVEAGIGAPVGGTVSRCSATGSCVVLASDLFFLTAVAQGRGTIWAAVAGGAPGSGQVIAVG